MICIVDPQLNNCNKFSGIWTFKWYIWSNNNIIVTSSFPKFICCFVLYFHVAKNSQNDVKIKLETVSFPCSWLYWDSSLVSSLGVMEPAFLRYSMFSRYCVMLEVWGILRADIFSTQFMSLVLLWHALPTGEVFIFIYLIHSLSSPLIDFIFFFLER